MKKNSWLMYLFVAVFGGLGIYLTFIAKKMPTNHPALGAATVFVWFVGFGAKGIGMTQGGGKVGFVLPLFFLNAIRTFAMFICIPQTCNNH